MPLDRQGLLILALVVQVVVFSVEMVFCDGPEHAYEPSTPQRNHSVSARQSAPGESPLPRACRSYFNQMITWQPAADTGGYSVLAIAPNLNEWTGRRRKTSLR